MGEVGDLEFVHLFRFVAEHGGERVVDLDDPAGHIRQPRADPGLGEHGPQSGLTGAQLFLHHTARRDVGGAHTFLFAEQPCPERSNITAGEGADQFRGPSGGDVEFGEVGGQHRHGAAEDLVADEMSASQIAAQFGDPRGAAGVGGVDQPPGEDEQQLVGLGNAHGYDVIADPAAERRCPSVRQVGVRTVVFGPIPRHVDDGSGGVDFM